MPHKKMQSYVNIDYKKTISIVGIIQERGVERIIAECRYSFYSHENIYEIAILVDEDFQRKGIASFMIDSMFTIAQKNGINRLIAYVLPENKAMISVFKNARIPPQIMSTDNELRIIVLLDRDYDIKIDLP